jgi:transposase
MTPSKEEPSMIKLSLTEDQVTELRNFRRQASSKDSEKALMVILGDQGKSVSEIAKTLQRHPHTIRYWLKRYKKMGLAGLARDYSPGRPNDKRESIKSVIKEILNHPPSKYGYLDQAWSVPLILDYLEKGALIKTSRDTVVRALKNLNYTYKRPSKQPPQKAPSKTEKVAAIQEMIGQIKELATDQEVEIFALDESHFSTEPYLVRGWFFKRWPPQDLYSDKKGADHNLWMLESKNTKILLEKIQKR